MNDLQTRRFTIRADADAEPRTVRGLAVPYGVEIELAPGYFESIAPGALADRADDATSLKLVWRHDEPIGLITSATETAEGIEIEARFSDTQTARDAYQLVKDGVIDRLSIGFIPLTYERAEADDGTHTTITSLDLREVSLVPFPAYDGATVTEVREQPTPTERTTPMTDAPAYALASDLDDLRADITAMEQRATLAAAERGTTPAADTRTPGEAIKALISDEAYRAEIAAIQTRAFNGTPSSGDATMVVPTWIKDLTRIVDKPNVLASLFSRGALPADGMELDFTELATNTLTVTEQTAEGADLQMGKVTTKKRSAPIKTFGGYTELTRQAIERTRINLLDTSLRGMAIAAGQASASYFAGQFAAAVKSQDASKLAVSKAATSLTWSDISGIFIDAAAKFADQALTLDGLGLIPTHAGKTRPPKVSRSKPVAHPHSRGENAAPGVEYTVKDGSSPLTRGKRHHQPGLGSPRGLIPTHAGKTRVGAGRSRRPRAHPHSRGENRTMPAFSASTMGSSPLTRGKHAGEHCTEARPGLIPTHAGKTTSDDHPTRG